MNITFNGSAYRVTTEQELLLLLGALAMLRALACGKAA
jgi:hypothetical protein